MFYLCKCVSIISKSIFGAFHVINIKFQDNSGWFLMLFLQNTGFVRPKRPVTNTVRKNRFRNIVFFSVKKKLKKSSNVHFRVNDAGTTNIRKSSVSPSSAVVTIRVLFWTFSYRGAITYAPGRPVVIPWRVVDVIIIISNVININIINTEIILCIHRARCYIIIEILA